MPTAAAKTQLVKKEIDHLASTALTAEELMQGIVRKLNERMLKYNWVGFYMLQSGSGQPPVLVLGPFVGAMTPHTRIPLNQGICGAAASSGKTVVVHDVNSDPRYLACSPAAFGPEDQELVEYCARLLGKHLETFRR